MPAAANVTGTFTTSSTTSARLPVTQGRKVVVQVSGTYTGSVYLFADAGTGTLEPTGNVFTDGDSGLGFMDREVDASMDVALVTGSTFSGTANYLIKTSG